MFDGQNDDSDAGPVLSSGALPDELSISNLTASEADRLDRFARSFGYDEIPDDARALDDIAADIIDAPDGSIITLPINRGDDLPPAA